MNKIRMGAPEVSILCWFVGMFLLLMMIFMGMPWMYILFTIMAIVFTLIGTCWTPWLVCKYKLRPGIDRCRSGETTWLRVTKDHIIAPQFVDKSTYGQTKGVTFKDKADVLDDGEFAIRWLNGNPGIIMYDLMNTNVDFNKSVARKIMKNKYGIRSGIEGYNIAKKEKERVLDG